MTTEKFRTINSIPDVSGRRVNYELQSLLEMDNRIESYVDADKHTVSFKVPESIADEFTKILRWRGWKVVDSGYKQAQNSQLSEIEKSLKVIKDNADQALKVVTEKNQISEETAQAPSIHQVVSEISNFLDVIEFEIDKIWRSQ